MKHRTICMLGGTGFVGRHIAALLARDGIDIRIVTRYAETKDAVRVLPTVRLIEADCHDPEVLGRAFSDCDAVINLVGILNEKGRKGEGFRHAHVDLTRKVLDACSETGVRRLLHMSALNAAAGGPSHYLRSKGEAEGLIQVHRDRGLQFTVFQPSTIFGRGDSFINRFAGLLRLMPGVFPLACPHARMAPVWVEDVAEAFVRALDNRDTFGKRFQLCGPDVMSLKEIVEYTARTMRIRRKVIGLPDFLSRLQANVMEFVPGKPFSRDNYKSLQLDSVCTSDGLSQLGIRPTGMDAVVPTYLDGGGVRGRYAKYREGAR
jgi:uncharacterized protein YbjT (DUF2867 family)